MRKGEREGEGCEAVVHVCSANNQVVSPAIGCVRAGEVRMCVHRAFPSLPHHTRRNRKRVQATTKTNQVRSSDTRTNEALFSSFLQLYFLSLLLLRLSHFSFCSLASLFSTVQSFPQRVPWGNEHAHHHHKHALRHTAPSSLVLHPHEKGHQNPKILPFFLFVVRVQ